MNELIKVNYDTEHPTVSARDLHEKLNIGTQYTKWFERMTEYGFSKNVDFKAISQKRLTAQGNETTYTDHEISIDMAKQICMIQRTPEGKQIRQYFLDLEKAWNTPEQVMARALKMAGKTIDSLKDRCKFLGGQVVEQQKLIEEMAPKANYVDYILESKSLVATTQIAKDYGMSAIRFNQILNSLKIQYKVNKQWVLYSKYQNCGYVHSKTIDITRSNGDPDVTMQTQWTQKGRLFLYEELKKNDIYPMIEQEVA